MDLKLATAVACAGSACPQLLPEVVGASDTVGELLLGAASSVCHSTSGCLACAAGGPASRAASLSSSASRCSASGASAGTAAGVAGVGGGGGGGGGGSGGGAGGGTGGGVAIWSGTLRTDADA
jgi:hypothetical protein